MISLKELFIFFLNTVHPNKNEQKLRVKLKQKTKTSTKHRGRVSSSNITDVIYEYLKTFSNYSIKKKGDLVGFELTLPTHDEKVLRIIQNKFGGTVHARGGLKAVRYRTNLIKYSILFNM